MSIYLSAISALEKEIDNQEKMEAVRLSRVYRSREGSEGKTGKPRQRARR